MIVVLVTSSVGAQNLVKHVSMTPLELKQYRVIDSVVIQSCGHDRVIAVTGQLLQ